MKQKEGQYQMAVEDRVKKPLSEWRKLNAPDQKTLAVNTILMEFAIKKMKRSDLLKAMEG